jgi:hypothetical protein
MNDGDVDLEDGLGLSLDNLNFGVLDGFYQDYED